MEVKMKKNYIFGALSGMLVMIITILGLYPMAVEAAWQKSGTSWYYHDGAKPHFGWVLTGDKWYYTDSNGKMLSNQRITYQNSVYYLQHDGSMVTGWYKAGNTWYYFNSSGAARQGWVKSGDSWYYTDKNGKMLTSQWITDKGKCYFLQANGVMATGWLKVENTWYYFDSSGAAKQGWVKSGNYWYYTDQSGKMLTNQWVTVNRKKYFLRSNGIMATSWYKDGTNWYYFDQSGAAVTGWILSSGKYYYVKEGVMQTDTWIDNYYVDNNGIWQKNISQTIKLSKTSATIGEGKTIDLTASASPYGSVTWSSSNSQVATVIDGRVTGVKAGTATIFASINGKKASCIITVTPTTNTIDLSQYAQMEGTQVVKALSLKFVAGNEKAAFYTDTGTYDYNIALTSWPTQGVWAIDTFSSLYSVYGVKSGMPDDEIRKLLKKAGFKTDPYRDSDYSYINGNGKEFIFPSLDFVSGHNWNGIDYRVHSEAPYAN